VLYSGLSIFYGARPAMGPPWFQRPLFALIQAMALKLRSDITVNGKVHPKGSDAPIWFIYPFFLFHMLMFGLSGFFMAYGAQDVEVFFLFMHGGIAITVYVIFYLTIFGLDEVKWMFINAGLGILGIYGQINWLLSLFDKQLSDYSWIRHPVPFIYYILYTFLLRQLLLDLLKAREDENKKKKVEYGYIGVSILLFIASVYFTRA
jgi:hypothetical protein